MPSAMVFVDVLPGTPAEHLRGLGTAVVIRNSDEARPPGATIWRGAAPLHARAGDGVLLEAEQLASASNALDRGIRPWLICRHPHRVQVGLEAGVGLWLRGSEAGGDCGQTTTLVLIRAVHADGPPAVPWVAEGLTRGARAATVAVGAHAVVLGPTVWSCDGSPLSPARPASLAALDLRKAWVGPGLRRAARIMASTAEQRSAITSDPASLSDLLRGWWSRDSGAAPAVASLCEMQGARHTISSRVSQEREALSAHLAKIPAHHPLRPECDPLGTGAPIVQGPMANVAEGTGLAAAVLSAGGLPFVALAALDAGQAAAVLDGADTLDGPVGAGLIAFEMAPFRQAHLDALAQRGPRPVIIAGGSIPLAIALGHDGFDAWMHTPSPRLARLALSAGVQTVVLEGHEAGGHVGPLPSSYLWEGGLNAAVEALGKGGISPPLVVLAGGIGDPISAAFCAALAAPACASGVRVALQVGTAFFYTREIADQLSETCRMVALNSADTVLVGSTVNLPLRCAPNEFTDLAQRQEQRWLTDGVPLGERRERMEAQNVGRTRLAAKGIERNAAWSGDDPTRRYTAVPISRQEREAAFTLGQGATVTNQVQSVAELFHGLTVHARTLLNPRGAWGAPSEVAGEPSAVAVPVESVRPLRSGPSPTVRSNPSASTPIAIVGLGCVLPGGGDVPSFWRSQVRGADSVGPIPASRWDPARYHHPDASSHGPALSSSLAAAVAASVPFDPLRYRIPPNVLPSVDPSQRLALLCGDEAAAEAGWLRPDFVRSRAAVILGNAMGGEWSSKMALRVRFREVVDALVADGHLNADDRAHIEPQLEARLDRDLLGLRPDSMVGLLGNLVAARLASWLDWSGGTHTVDAACAASLVAVAQSVDLLRAGRVDAVITGGVDTDLSPDTFVGFTRTLALSSAGSRPFSSAADGFVMGEGGAVFALKRLDDALNDADPIWAVIRGVGVASDGRGRGLTAPLPDGQTAALQRAWKDADLDPRSAAYIEAHGTGTELGDRTEAGVISQFFGRDGGAPWVGTAKGSVGHLKSAAGAAGLLRAVLTVATGVVPPTLNAGEPIDEAADVNLPRRATQPVGGVVRAGVSAFGFGGTNAHIVVEAPPTHAKRPSLVKTLLAEAQPFLVPEAQATWSADHPATGQRLQPSPTLHCFGADSTQALADAVESGQVCEPADATAPHRAALLTFAEDRVLRANVAAYLRGEAADPGIGRRVWIGHGAPRPLVLLAPGQGGRRSGARDSVRRFASANPVLDALSAVFGTQALSPTDTRAQHRDLFSVGCAWSAVLAAAGVSPAYTLGHSLGEWAALVAAGESDAVELAPLVKRRGQALHGAAPGAMLAVIGSPQDATQLATAHDLHVAAYNSPRTTILAGSVAAISAAHNAHSSVRTARISVEHAFHTPTMGDAAEQLRNHLAELSDSPGSVWISAHSGAHARPRTALIDAITSPVRFAQALAALPSDVLAVELGPGSTLTSHARATGLEAVPLDPDPIAQPHGVHAAAAALWAAGHTGLVQHLPDVVLSSPIIRRESGPAAQHISPGLTTPPAPERAPVTSRSAQPNVGAKTSTTDAVLAALTEVTGYDAATLMAASDLQGDLGVDSIQRLEVMGLLQERLELTGADEDLGELGPINVDALIATIERQARVSPAKTPEPAFAFAHREWWQPIEVVRGPAPKMGWSDYLGTRCWRMPPQEDALIATKNALAAAKAEPPSEQPCMAWVLDTPEGHAAAAAMRTAAAERSIPFQAVFAHSEAAGLAAPVLADVVRLGAQTAHAKRWRTNLEPTEPAPNLVLATGGVRGIVLPCVVALKPKSAWLSGRTPASSPAVADALSQLQKAGIDGHYAQCDLTDSAAVQHLATLLKPDLVVHGAGVLRDRRLDDLQNSDVDDVFAVKVGGLGHLRRAFPDARIVTLSSLAAHAGNPGQIAYSAANAAAEQMSDGAVAFTAWGEVGMASGPTIQAALRAIGVRPLTVAEGCDAFVRAVGSPGTTLVTTAPPPNATPLPWPIVHVRRDGDAITASLRLDPSDSRLAHHQIGAQIVVPAATWVDLTLGLLAMFDREPALQDLNVTAPCLVPSLRHDVRVHLDLGGGTVEIRSATASLAKASLAKASLVPRAAPPSMPAAPTPTRPAKTLYRPDLLFHGPSWQVLRSLGTDGNGTLSADLHGTETAGVIDGAHQLIATWAAKDLGWTGLPVGAARWSTYEGTEAVRLSATCEAGSDQVLADVVGWDATGAVVLVGEGVRLRRAADVSPDLVAMLRSSG